MLYWLYYSMLCCTILGMQYYTMLYTTLLSYTILCYTILYYTILCYTILYYTILYYTILYYTILCYAILYYATPCYTPLHYTRSRDLREREREKWRWTDGYRDAEGPSTCTHVRTCTLKITRMDTDVLVVSLLLLPVIQAFLLL